MSDSENTHTADYGCESRCVHAYVECMETEEGASICRTREQNCFDECEL